MARVLITGMSGAGKSTLLAEVARRGHRTVDTDAGEWQDAEGRFYDRFDHVVLLSAPVEVLLDRVRTRTNNPYGKTQKEQDDIRRYTREVEPLLRRGATIELDGRRPVGELADVVEELLGR